ncbi:hypothetical protein DFA_07409 [Cavenderia fasciculata]|uniref:Uncharacterized protein n=1 Tax=Cavenderia fasciculata TaxID=261658 RepID=F4PWC2_CACFS|nr:uncharacterized protein DFA_07409 [Cavenderia fasciculata]EGG20286.1 hypothetical protein DFA_07409 [Cavenderia fasciculata]|eukprot:XP_004367269.1 hypothetical protein DFA_07409 [Cavenderia fasciculata]
MNQESKGSLGVVFATNKSVKNSLLFAIDSQAQRTRRPTRRA